MTDIFEFLEDLEDEDDILVSVEKLPSKSAFLGLVMLIISNFTEETIVQNEKRGSEKLSNCKFNR